MIVLLWPLQVLAGHKVCRESWAYLLGIGKNRLARCRHVFQGKDLRSVSGQGRHLSHRVVNM